MKLKMKQIAFLIAGLSASAASMANNVTPADIEAARASTLQQAWITGASAPTASIYEGWVRGCDAGTNSIFSSQTTSAVKPGSLGNFVAYACKRSGVVSVLYHTVDGGSVNAYTPHTSIGTVLGRVAYIGTNSNCAVSSSSPWVDSTNTANNAVVYKSCSQAGATSTPTNSATNQTALTADPNGPQLPVGGYSDVEVSLFPSRVSGGSIVGRGTETNVGVGQVFAVAVSIPLYRALQTAQNITTTTENQDDPANAPNISSADYVNIISVGGLKNWSALLPNSTNKVILARRADTSGTQAASNAFFLRNPCNTGVGQQLVPTTLANDNVAGVYEVSEGAGTSNAIAALAAATTANQYAIGILSAENPGSTAVGHRFVKLDGVHPEAGDTTNARLTAANGTYKFHMELKQFVRANYNGKPNKTTFENAILGQITAQLKTPPQASCQTYPRGLTLNPSNNSLCTIGVEIARMTNNGQNCAAPVKFY